MPAHLRPVYTAADTPVENRQRFAEYVDRKLKRQAPISENDENVTSGRKCEIPVASPGQSGSCFAVIIRPPLLCPI